MKTKSTYPDHNFDRHGNRRDAPLPGELVGATLARTLACYVSEEDSGLTRAEFLRAVRDRINMDLADGAPVAADNQKATK